MDVVGTEIGLKMRSAIKAKLTELGCYVDDELPDYVMVMVANKRTRAQMEDDLQLFLGDNTELFVNWLHQVLKKLQEVTVSAPIKGVPGEKNKERSRSKDRKTKEKKSKVKSKKGDVKKAKKKDKDKSQKKEMKKAHKTKKKSKHHEMIRPNIPPLLMNMEKESEPSITDVFAGQILKNHGITLDSDKEDKVIEKKPVIIEKRPILPIIDPATITSPPKQDTSPVEVPNKSETITSPVTRPREEQLKEMNEIENKIQGLKQKLADQLETMSDDEDFLNIRTEAEELMNDFAEDVFQEISQQAPVATPPLEKPKSPPVRPIPKSIEIVKTPQKDPVKTLPQIELKLPKRPVRERLGVLDQTNKVADKKKEKEKRNESPERFTPEREPEVQNQLPKKSRSERTSSTRKEKRNSYSENGGNSDNAEHSSKRLTSRVKVLDKRQSRTTCASVVRVRPRPRVSANSSSLLLKAVADAHKSLLNIPPKVNVDSEQQVKRAMVLPMRRTVEPQKIVIEVPVGDILEDDNDRHGGDTISLGGDGDSDCDKLTGDSVDTERDEYVPVPITKRITNTDYVPSRQEGRTASLKNDSLTIEAINIHNPSVGKDKNTQFIVTMDGFNPNAFLAKKLQSEGLLNDDESNDTPPAVKHNIVKEKPTTQNIKEKSEKERVSIDKEIDKVSKEKNTQPVVKEKESLDEEKKETELEEIKKTTISIPAKRLSNTSEESDTQVIIKREEDGSDNTKSCEMAQEEVSAIKKRKASPIVFDVEKKQKVERIRTESTSSDNHVTVNTTTKSHKYDSVPPLSQAERKLVWCRAFPGCRYGAACAYAHPRCKFAAACTRRGCVYSHAPNAPVPSTPPPSIASHVVPVANYKTISGNAAANVCKYYPHCTNAACHFYHPKPCRYGKLCANKLECNFYHLDVPSKYKTV